VLSQKFDEDVDHALAVYRPFDWAQDQLQPVSRCFWNSWIPGRPRPSPGLPGMTF